MRTCRLLVLFLLWCAPLVVHTQEVPLEYQVKAVYLFNFIKFVEWPSSATSGPLTICVADRNPFGEALQEVVRGELVNARRVSARVVTAPEAGCHVLFVPNGAAISNYLRTTSGAPILTVGETPGFIRQGGIVNFILEEGKVRFEIDPRAAERADLRISSHLLRLARSTGPRQQP